MEEEVVEVEAEVAGEGTEVGPFFPMIALRQDEQSDESL